MIRPLLIPACLLAVAGCTSSPRAPAPRPSAPSPRAQAPAPADGGARCSASGLRFEPAAPQPPLPPEVESMRRRILTAALACDYATLAALGREKEASFSFTFGPGEDAAAFWREQERKGRPVLAMLVKVLELPHAKDGTLYVWPSVFRVGATEADWQALKSLYPEQQLADWKHHGEGYLGFRVGIHETGDWLFAIAGD